MSADELITAACSVHARGFLFSQMGFASRIPKV
jgi:hypothetical protein